MPNSTSTPRILLTSLLLLLLLSACGGEPEPTPTPTRPPLPTFTPTPMVQSQAATATPEPTATVAPVVADAATVTPVPMETPAPAPFAPQLTVDGDGVNIRSGPDTAFEIVGTGNTGETFPITGRTAAGDWWQICCFADQPGWIFAALTTAQDVAGVAVAADIPALPPTPIPAPAAVAPTTVPAANPAQPPDPAASSAGFFDPNTVFQITKFRVLGLGENNGGIRSSSALHIILVTVLDAEGNPMDGVTIRNLVGDKLDVISGSKGPGTAEITMYWEPYKLTIAADSGGPTTSQVSNQMGLAFPHLPDIVGKLGGLDYEYAVCPTIDIKCDWPIQAVHFSYEITFQKVK